MEQNPDKYAGDLALISRQRSALMGIAALIVCCFHEFLPVAPAGTWINSVEDFIIRVSFYGVDVFMLLSGMSVAFSLLKTPDAGEFYAKRAKRILPFYILSGVAMIFLAGWSIKDFFLNITGVSFFTTSVNSYLWFVIVLIIFYLLAPLYQKLLSSAGNPLIVFVVSFVLWVVLSIIIRGHIRDDFYYGIDRMPVFMLGMLLGNLIYNGVKVRYPVAFWLGILSLFLIGWMMSYLSNYYGYDYLIGVVLSFLPRVALGVSVPYICAKILDLVRWKWLDKLLGFFGSFCFELYIVQRVFDARLHYFLRDHGIWGITRNLLMLVILSLIAFVSSRIVNYLVDKICSLDISKQNK
ncbi:MAG: acyltransferase [Clostridiales bacterium]|nr:acyltransferase [Clostridiales bacterium]